MVTKQLDLQARSLVISNSNNTTVDMGMYQTSRIGNFVWEDSNGDGIQDPGEVGIDGVTITLRDSGGVVVDTETTIAGGLYTHF
jgi:serine-aspartate repeat-containing protein C/D/E